MKVLALVDLPSLASTVRVRATAAASVMPLALRPAVRWRGLGGELMTKVWLRWLYALFAMIGASTSSRAQDAKVITYDEWSAIESAKRSCERALAWHKERKGLIAQLGCDSIPSCNEMMPTVMACTMTNAARGSQQFENKMVSEFFKNPSCKGITWAGHRDPTEAAKVSVAEAILKPHWALSARLNLGSEKQYWQVVYNKTGTYAEGTDSPSGIVEKLCTLINGPGSAVLN
jgi:hypothetical protein